MLNVFTASTYKCVNNSVAILSFGRMLQDMTVMPTKMTMMTGFSFV